MEGCVLVINISYPHHPLWLIWTSYMMQSVGGEFPLSHVDLMITDKPHPSVCTYMYYTALCEKVAATIECAWSLMDFLSFLPRVHAQGVKQLVCPSVVVVVVVGMKIVRSRVLGIYACCKHNQSVDIGEKLFSPATSGNSCKTCWSFCCCLVVRRRRLWPDVDHLLEIGTSQGLPPLCPPLEVVPV